MNFKRSILIGIRTVELELQNMKKCQLQWISPSYILDDGIKNSVRMIRRRVWIAAGCILYQ